MGSIGFLHLLDITYSINSADGNISKNNYIEQTDTDNLLMRYSLFYRNWRKYYYKA